MQCQIPEEWELQSLVLYSGNTAKVLKKSQAITNDGREYCEKHTEKAKYIYKTH
jgi:hypothetical protein